MTRTAAVLVGIALLFGACSGGASSSIAPSASTRVGPSAAPAPTPSVVPTARPTPTPVLGVGICPTGSPLSVQQFSDADAACLGGADIEIRGWLDQPPGVGFVPPLIEPTWIAYPAPGLPSLWTGRPVEPDHICPSDPLPCAWFFLHVDPASGLNLEISPREIIVTGHLDDPAAGTCHYVYPDDWTDERPDDANAIASCRGSFIVVSFRDAP